MKPGLFRKMLWASLALAGMVGIVPAQEAATRPTMGLGVSENHRFLIDAQGRPFFFLADTAWELFHRLNREEAQDYLKDRAAKHFNVIQACVLAEYGGLTVPNAYGHLPLSDNDPAKPNEEYFKDVDWVVEQAQGLRLYVGMLPTWGDKVNKKWGMGPEIFTPQNAGAYGEFLGKRYKDKPIIWILGGDRPIEDDRQMAIWRAMAAGIAKGDGGAHLMTFHPMGGRSSSEWLQSDGWLAFNMLQSGHSARDIATWGRIWTDYQKQPIKPTLDAEPNYEDHPINWMPQNGYFNDFDVRKQAYWSVFAGACGYTYGCHDIWQFYQPGRDPISSARTPWRDAMKLPGAGQMQWLIGLMMSRPFLSRVPDQSLIVSTDKSDGAHCQATRDADGTYAFIYVPDGSPVKIDLRKLGGVALKAWWYDPRNGGANPAGDFTNQAVQEFIPPAAAKGAEANDWVLVLDDAAKHYAAPGGVAGGK
ncbi:MAG TPA: glycoside hydrolase family 140 protein [Tepidisphaeraceae bacterium]|jgi:hypothetical protein